MEPDEKKCPACAEAIKKDAKVCKFCHKALGITPGKIFMTFITGAVCLGLGGCGLMLVAGMIGLSNMSHPSSNSSTTSGGEVANVVPAAQVLMEQPPSITAKQFMSLKNGMTYKQVCKVLGREGELQSENELAGYRTSMYSWSNGNLSNMNAMFQNGKMMQKAQMGLE
jgi:hypothetical protein